MTCTPVYRGEGVGTRCPRVYPVPVVVGVRFGSRTGVDGTILSSTLTSFFTLTLVNPVTVTGSSTTETSRCRTHPSSRVLRSV